MANGLFIRADGTLSPVKTTTERDAISSPATGLMIFNSTDGAIQFFNGSTWTSLAGTGVASGTQNIGLAAAQTGFLDDSIKITSQTGTALSPSNPGFVTMSDATSGKLLTFTVSADITIDLTGAHWGAGGKGDLTDQNLVVYAINVAGTIQWGVGTLSQLKVLVDNDEQTTATNVTIAHNVLVTALIAADAHVLMVGTFKADFTDTGGDSEDIWAVQTGTGDIKMGFVDLVMTSSFSTTASQSIANNTTVRIDYATKEDDTHNVVTTGASWVWTAPIGGTYQINAAAQLSSHGGFPVSSIIELELFNGASEVRKLTFYQYDAVSGSGQAILMNGSTTLALNRNDAISARIRQTSGETLTLNGTATENYIDIVWIGD